MYKAVDRSALITTTRIGAHGPHADWDVRIHALNDIMLTFTHEPKNTHQWYCTCSYIVNLVTELRELSLCNMYKQYSKLPVRVL